MEDLDEFFAVAREKPQPKPLQNTPPSLPWKPLTKTLGHESNNLNNIDPSHFTTIARKIDFDDGHDEGDYSKMSPIANATPRVNNTRPGKSPLRSPLLAGIDDDVVIYDAKPKRRMAQPVANPTPPKTLMVMMEEERGKTFGETTEETTGEKTGVTVIQGSLVYDDHPLAFAAGSGRRRHVNDDVFLNSYWEDGGVSACGMMDITGIKPPRDLGQAYTYFIIVRGEVEVTIADTIIVVGEGGCFKVPSRTVYGLKGMARLWYAQVKDLS